ncbi:MAG: type II secretion system ATPase GspE [bacterium]|nr:type II secretion system ATPase GspE [bacterium]MDD5354391.1 type II secretion system ATPase GspE [bacterium]MDD5755856.1 type II secretion system ATPase GspE [bacterium]
MPTNWENSLQSFLLKDKFIEDEQWLYAKEIQKEEGERIDRILLRLNFVKEEQIFKAFSQIFNIPYIKISEEKLDLAIVRKVSVKYATHHKIIPLREEKGTILIAVSDPLDIQLQDELRLLIGQNIKIYLANSKEIEEAIEEYYGIGADTMEDIARTQGTETIIHTATTAELAELEKKAEGDEASIIKFVNQLIVDAYHSRATDIHIEPFEGELRVRYRIDGVLHRISAPAAIKQFEAAIVSRIKIMAELNIAEKRLPQDGRIKLRLEEEEIDIRISTIPTIWGESVDLRILPRNRVLLGLEQLGVQESDLKNIEKLIKIPHGIVLVTGPTGSGKTTTLYACLNKINSQEKMIVTIEDPVEYQLGGINQIQVKPKIGLTFAEGLRSILRQDPNIIMVGEIRDPETAEIAIRASLTGHLVFSTLHTNDACGAITRLIDMGIAPYLVSSSVEAALAQRLVRVLCPHCKIAYHPDQQILDEMEVNAANSQNLTIYRAAEDGCDHCNHMGYKRRTGIYELLMINDDIRRVILERGAVSTIREKGIALGMKTLRMDGWSKVLQGVTSLDEVLRVT